MLKLLIELVKKDLLIFWADKRALVITFAVPIGIASFLAPMIGNISGGGGTLDPIAVLVVDQDQSAATKATIDRLSHSKSVKVQQVSLDVAKEKTLDGDVSTAVVFDKGFGQKAAAAMNGGPRPDLDLLTDPSKAIETKVAEGAVIEATIHGAAQQAFGSSPATDSMPFNLTEQPQSKQNKVVLWSGSVHAFEGLGVQGLLFGAMEAAMGMMRDRRNGLWARLRASPVSPWMLLIARLIGGSAQSFLVFLGVFGTGMLLYKFRIDGSIPGFFLITAALAIMVSAAGLFIAALGKSEKQSRGLSILVILLLLMTGGAWVPAFAFPGWMQTISLFSPIRWAIDGFDAMTWRGFGFHDALAPVGVLLLFAVVLTVVAGLRFKWEPEAG